MPGNPLEIQQSPKSQVTQRVKAFVQNVHHFRDEYLRDARPPSDHIAVFDEAQRAWNAEQTAAFMERKKNKPGFTMSEPRIGKCTSLRNYMTANTRLKPPWWRCSRMAGCRRTRICT
ncbi:DUF2075 domain-containing protein [Caldimonas thermodepolymerans]|uniref:DUF2075 domain-containing protein n=1 Tax=Caldimonas thermodepolymerans TaxID=215580 RepID=UPI00223583DB|nr:DUF2075 domain-containing protein [Caldimonas thermodepolymerans]UZG44416.1 DUF2075 domain-containing protein [Caldimonas thermodepolymerans]